MVQECDTLFGFFDANHKANAQHYNMQRDDINSYLKYGYTVHGEWFLDGERLPHKGDAEHLSFSSACGELTSYKTSKILISDDSGAVFRISTLRDLAFAIKKRIHNFAIRHFHV